MFQRHIRDAGCGIPSLRGGYQSLKQMKPFDPGYLTLNRYYVSIPLVRELAL